MRIHHSVAVQEKAVSADTVEVFDLAVNPLSVILVAIRPLNDTGTLSNFQNYMGLVGSLNRVAVLHRGQSVFSMSGRDCAALNYLRHGIVPRELNPSPTNNERRCVVLPILLGRWVYDHICCFPASKRGELVMELDIDVADTGYDGFRYSVETVEILDARPKEYERKVSIAQTFAATGDQIFPLPTGHTVRGLMGFGTTGFTGASPAPTWGRFSLFLENQQHSISATDVEVAATLNALMGRQPPALDGHIHLIEPVAGVVTDPPQEQGTGGWDNYWWFDLDPSRDDAFALDTSDATSFQLRASVETADAARVIPIERVKVSERD
jgi:hypothetical protein